MQCSTDIDKCRAPLRALPAAPAHAQKLIGITLFNGFALPEAAAIVEVFQLANAFQPGAARYEVCLLSASGGRISSSSSVFIWTDSVDADCHRDSFDALFIAGGAGVRSALHDERLLGWLRRVHPRSELIFPIAEGQLLLDSAGLGRGASERRHMGGARVIPLSGLGASTSLDAVSPLRAALTVIEEDLGADAVRQIASRVVSQIETQSARIERHTPSFSATVSDQIQASAQWLEANCDRQISITDAAAVASMSERNFLRRFKVEMGLTPSDYLRSLRLDMTCRMLTETNLPVDKIARRCGMGGGERLAKIFRKHLAVSPTEYRVSQRLSNTSM
jgi:transcriptional regulator GlxA family with amidase domain